MATMDLKAFCKKFKAYEKRVSARTAWSELLGEVGNATKNITTRAFENQKALLMKAGSLCALRLCGVKKAR